MANLENESGVAGPAAALTFADVREEFAPEWQVQQEHFCWTATRRPTATAVHVVTGQTLDMLAAKLRAERDSQG